MKIKLVSLKHYFFILFCTECFIGFSLEKELIDIWNDVEVTYKDCGVPGPPKEHKGKISDGNESANHRWPWMVYLSINNFTNWCAGTLISLNFILTAAHCALDRDGKQLPLDQVKVLYGSNNYLEMEAYKPVNEVIVHPKYDHFDLSTGYDIALFKLTKQLEPTDIAHPICLPSPSLKPYVDLTKDLTYYIAGWGDTRSSFRPQLLRESKVTLWTHKECNIKRNTTTPNRLCGGDNAVPCQGDSGGPLMLEMNNKKFVQLGVASTIYPSGCQNAYIFYYIQISQFTQWIKDNTDL